MSETCSHNCDTCASKCSNPTPAAQQSMILDANESSNVKKVIAVVSGKGGVGKSMVTSSLAVLMNKAGKEVGILDADITGPSIPTAFGIKEKAYGSPRGILPAITKTGIKMMSVNLLLENETDPVVWRGSLIANAVKQFWQEVVWEDLDFLFVDMPPGTGDVPLTVFQSLPVDGIVIVTSPQELVSMIVDKAVKMAEMMHVPILGIVENLSYFNCTECGTKHYIYGESHIHEIAKKHEIPVVCQLPIDPAVAARCDRGDTESFSENWMDELVAHLQK
ncbi:Mrp/NBP35 family ATP-binding protein [Chakrabartyella piscis]|uniref:Mrp/NBP35 family ATP-binding protein n=1 Tax=Chakrabartyella piscis TaxID=2918914 RepID=UPI002958DD01|nr:Mrp/NBP35 family ATP-binding protein [Chakrabartyella piscis]